MAGKGSRVVHKEVLDVLLALRIKEVDLQKEKEEEINPSKKLTFEQRRMFSKRQRKVCYVYQELLNNNVYFEY
jgi:hypothetical protein